jgi:hypothetical protein
VSTPRITRRDGVVVAVTAAVCFAVAIPLTSASSRHSHRQFTVWPGNSARFANMDWNCDYSAEFTAKKQGGGSMLVPAQIQCVRESTARGLRFTVTGDDIDVARCGGGSGTNIAWCQRLFSRARRP